MPQHDYVIDNQTFPATRTDINNALSAIARNNSGASAPATTYAQMWWYDTTTDTLKFRNDANDAWIDVAVMNQTTDAIELAGTTAFTRSLLDDTTEAAARTTLGASNFIATLDASNSSSLDFTAFDSAKWDGYCFDFFNILGDATADLTPLQIRLSTNGGSSYDNSAIYDWSGNLISMTGSPASTLIGGAADTHFEIGGSTLLLRDTASAGMSGRLIVLGPHVANWTQVTWSVVGRSTTDYAGTGGGIYNSTTAVDALQFLPGAGTIASGTVTMSGIRAAV